ncbi:MAG TPA: penicillin-binding transpeptidase domain-containing protein [Polyangiaceae bacterium]|nr:penicillin-binding transpeptidase domain-containing protein [Polyangiaceae bacterium]
MTPSVTAATSAASSAAQTGAPAAEKESENDPRVPRGLRNDVEAYLDGAGIVKGPHTTELTIDPAIQGLADEVAARTVAKETAREAFVIVLDPKTGEVLALSGKRRAAAAKGSQSAEGDARDAWDLAVRSVYTPASVTKTYTAAAALDAGAIRVDQRFGGEKGKWRIGGDTFQDGVAHGNMSVADVLVLSSNIGAGKMAVALGRERLGDAFHRFHLGVVPRIELAGAAAGDQLAFGTFSTFKTAVTGAGHNFKMSPLQMAMAFVAVANDGVYEAPTLVRSVKDGAGRAVTRGEHEAQVILRPETAHTVLKMLEGVVEREDGTGKQARIAGCHIAAKTGTGEDAEGWLYGSIVGAFPSDKPRVVIFAGAVAPESKGYGGGTIAAPMFREIAEKIIAKTGC